MGDYLRCCRLLVTSKSLNKPDELRIWTLMQRLIMYCNIIIFSETWFCGILNSVLKLKKCIIFRTENEALSVTGMWLRWPMLKAVVPKRFEISSIYNSVFSVGLPLDTLKPGRRIRYRRSKPWGWILNAQCCECQKSTMSMHFVKLQTCLTLFWSWRGWPLSRWRRLLGLRVVPIHPRFVMILNMKDGLHGRLATLMADF